MKAVVTRVASASVEIEGKINGAIDRGFLVLLGVGPNDNEKIAQKMADKICNLRVFEDENGKMNLDLATVGGSLLVVSQFTLYADTSSRRPGFSGAAKPDLAIPLYEKFMELCRQKGFRVEHGEFGADMQVYSQNDGPVTILLDIEAEGYAAPNSSRRVARTMPPISGGIAAGGIHFRRGCKITWGSPRNGTFRGAPICRSTPRTTVP